MANISPQDRVAQEQFELVLRLQQTGSSQPSDSAARLRLRAQALVKDLLISKLEVDADLTAHEYVHTQGFCDLGKALVASRSLQIAFEGFCSAIPNGASVSMVLDSPAPQDAFSADPGPSIEQRDLLASARPFQVLVTQAFYNKLQHRQPVALRSLPAHAGVYEFLWTSEERLAELQNQDEFMPTLVIPAPPSPATVSRVNDQTFFMPIEDLSADETLPPVFRDEPGTVDRESGQGLRRQVIIAMSGAAAILIVLGYLGIANPALNRMKEIMLAYTTGGSAPAPSRPPIPAPSYPTVPALSPSIPALSPPQDPQPHLPPKTLPPRRTRPCSIEKNVIPEYLKLGADSQHSGNYADAIRQYNKVLDCDSVNREARDGLLRAKKAQFEESANQ